MKLWNRFNEPEREAWHDYEKEARREQIKSIVKTVLKVALVICAVVFAKSVMDGWQNRELMREAESKVQESAGVEDPSQSSSCQDNAPIGGGVTIDQSSSSSCQGNASIGGGATIDQSSTTSSVSSVRTCSDDGHGHLVESQDYSFERISDDQFCGLIHFAFENGKEALEDQWVFFSPGDMVEVTYAELDGYQTLAPGCWSWEPFELTVTYYAPKDVYCRAYEACSVGPDNICTDVQPDGTLIEAH